MRADNSSSADLTKNGMVVNIQHKVVIVVASLAHRWWRTERRALREGQTMDLVRLFQIMISLHDAVNVAAVFIVHALSRSSLSLLSSLQPCLQWQRPKRARAMDSCWKHEERSTSLPGLRPRKKKRMKMQPNSTNRQQTPTKSVAFSKKLVMPTRKLPNSTVTSLEI